MGGHSSGLFPGTIGDLSFELYDEVRHIGASELKGTLPIRNVVTDSIRTGSANKIDPEHAFPDVVDNYAGYAHMFSLVGGDGVERLLLQLAGSLNGAVGIFEWIVDPNPERGVTHRRFIAGGKITGNPNQRRGGTR